MKKQFYLLLICLGSYLLTGCGKPLDSWEVFSPDGTIKMRIEKKDAPGEDYLVWSVFKNNQQVVNPSRMGLIMDGVEYSRNLLLNGKPEFHEVNTVYELKAGKSSLTSDRCKEMILTFSHESGISFSIISRAYDDGVAFSYKLEASGDDKMHVITQELTEFDIPRDGKAWIHPYDWNDRHKPSYETYAQNGIKPGTDFTNGRGWAFPMLFNTANVWMMVTEAHLDGTYPATHIKNEGQNGNYSISFPEADEVVVAGDPSPISGLPWQTPWRLVIVGDDLNTIFRTHMVTHLNPTSVIEDEDWVKPGRSSWSWWYEGSSVRSYKKQIQYVNLSAEMNWEYMLIDASWQNMGDGGNMEDVVKYANDKGVGIWLWYHSGAGIGEDRPAWLRVMSDPVLRKKEMEYMNRIGVKGIKVDFFDTDKQQIIKLYPEILQDAANYKLLVNFHGATLPRGFERTYPNLLTTEAIRGAETLGRQERCDRAAAHNATVPFTRNVVGSMDYTPVTFSNKIRQGVVAYRRTTVAHQLALAVVFESGFQCFADRAEAYLSLSEIPKNFLKEVPAAWDESILLDGYPGEFAVIARRKGESWFLGGINGTDQPMTKTLNLPSACKGKGFTLITDGENADMFGYTEIHSEDGTITVEMAPQGGFAAKIK